MWGDTHEGMEICLLGRREGAGGCMSKISLGKFKEMLDALVRNVPLRGKSSSLLTGECTPSIPQAHCSSFLNSEVRGEEKQRQDCEQGQNRKGQGDPIIILTRYKPPELLPGVGRGA